MQNAGQQYGQGGGVSSHQTTSNSNFGHSESSSSITSSLRQFRRKPEDKHQPQQELNPQPQQQAVPDSHVARVAPHSHYPSAARPGDCYRYTVAQYPEYSVPSQVKYSEISEPHQPIQEHVTPSSSVIQKAKGKDYMDMCSIQQSHVMKQPYPEHMGSQQPYAEHNVLPQSQYIPKEAQIHSLYKQQESQYFPKDPQFPAQLPHQMPKYNNVPSSQLHKDFLSQLQKIHPSMARAIMNDHHMKEPPRSYQTIDQNRIYNQPRYINHPTSPIQGNIYPHGYGPPPQSSYPNYPSSCSYTRAQQIPPRFPPINPHERSISPRRNYADGMNMPMNYPGITQKVSPNYPQYNSSEYPQHFQQQRRGSMPQEYYQQHCRPTQYIPHQLPTQDLPDSGRVTVSDNIKQYIENWADEETATEMNQIENNRLCKENVRSKEGQSNETIYAINASDLQYLEPIVGTETGIPVVTSENGQYVLKSGVSLDNSSGMLRLVDKNDLGEQQGDRVVNLQIMDPTKSDCMLAGAKPTQDPNHCTVDEPPPQCDKSRIVIHQNTVIQSGSAKEKDTTPEMDEQVFLEEELNRTIIREHKRETADKNCSPINLDQALNDDGTQDKVMYPSRKVVEEINCKNMPIIETPSEQAEDLSKPEVTQSEAEVPKSAPFEEPSKIDSPTPPNIDEEKKGIEQPPPSPTLTEPSTIELPQIPTQDTEKPSSNEQLQTNENPSEATTIIEKNSNNLESLDLSMKYGAQEDSKPKRTRRFFSVDDIINNIGSSMTKSNQESEERRHSIHTTAEFLNREINNTFKPEAFEIKTIQKEKKGEPEAYKFDKINIVENEIEDDKSEENVTSDEKMEATDVVPQAANGESNENSVVSEVVDVLDHIKTEIEDTNTKTENDPEETEEPVSNVTKDHDETVIDKTPERPKNSPASRQQPQDKAGQEVQYRNIIRVDESNVLLHIAGELVEVNVHTVNGKKMITVVPLSSSTVADLNDNYETLDGNEAATDRQGDDNDGGGGDVVDYGDGAKPELASEVVIGMDLSLEEEIQLDLEQPQVICTKAAKKAYDCDLQIPSITTSEDVYDDETKLDSKVSSSKEKAVVEEESKPATVSEVKTVEAPEDDEFVPFKDLIKARKLRKMRMKASKNEIKADSTNKIDEVVNPGKKEQTPTDKSSNLDDKKEPEAEKYQKPTKRVSFSEPIDSRSTPSASPSKEPERKSPTTPRVVPEHKSIASSRAAPACKEPEHKSTNVSEHKSASSARNAPASKDSERKSATTSEHKSGTTLSGTTSEHKSASSARIAPVSKDSERKSATTSEHKSGTTTSGTTSEHKSATTPEHKSDTTSEHKNATTSEPKSATTSEHKSATPTRITPTSKQPEHRSATTSEPKIATPTKTAPTSKQPEQRSPTASEHKGATTSEHKSATTSEHKSATTSEHKSATPIRIAPTSKQPERGSATASEPKSATTSEPKSVTTSESKSTTPIRTSPTSKQPEQRSPTTLEHKSATTSARIAPASKDSERKSATTSESKSTTPSEHKNANPIRTSPTSKQQEQRSATAPEHKCATSSRLSPVCKEPDHKSVAASEHKSTTATRVAPTCKQPEHRSGTASEHKSARTAKDYKSFVAPMEQPALRASEKTETKRKLSLEEYNRRKRKVVDGRAIEQAQPSKRSRDDMHVTPSPTPAKIRFHRGKSLDESKRRSESNSLKRSFSGATSKEIDEKRPRNPFDRCKDEMLQIYKEQVESKLSSLSIQIPRVVKCANNNNQMLSQQFPAPKATGLMERFLRNEHLTPEEMQKVRKIVSCKRLVQQLKKVRGSVPPGQRYEVNKEPGDRETKLHLKKLPDKKARKRFRNLYGDSSTDSDSDDSKNQGDYSVVQSNCLAGVVPKLIIKRKPEASLPFVKLERLDMRLLVNKKYAD